MWQNVTEWLLTPFQIVEEIWDRIDKVSRSNTRDFTNPFGYGMYQTHNLTLISIHKSVMLLLLQTKNGGIHLHNV